jgi:ATP-dependent exoDNAse (exonuclease V) alpha subunit
MQQEGGIDALSPEHRASAERSYEAWAELNPRPAAKYDLADYVSYAQEREAERQAEADPDAQQKATETRAAFRALMAEIEASPELVTVTADEGGRARFTSQSQLAAEMQMEQAAAGLAERTGHAVRQRTRNIALAHTEAAQGFALSAEQRAAFNHVTGKEDIALVVGYAGAGKSTMLNAARAAWEAEGYRVQGTALSGIAAQGLQDSAGIESRNLHQFLHRLESGEERAEQLAAMDARIAGITGQSSKAQKFRADLTRRRADMAADMERGSLSDRDVIVVDEAAMIGARQMERLLTAAHQAGAKVVLVGDHEQLQAIEAGAAFRALMDRHGAAQMTEIFRQREDWQREATKQFPTGKARQALDAYRDHGMTHQAETRNDAKAALVEAWQAGRERDTAGTQIILAHLRADVTDLNRLARAAYRTEGRLGEDHELELRDGRMTLAEGDRLLFGKNDRQLGVKNGTLATVERIEGGKITVALDGKKETPERVTFDLADYQSISHGYAATVHKTQGATVDRAYVLATGGMDRHLAYVGMTRHRERADLFYAREDFKDHEAMTRQLARDGAKDTTLDYLAAAEAGKGFAASFRQAVGKAWQTIRQVFDRGDMHPAERAERDREQAQRDRAAEAERERAAARAAREKAERGKTSPLSPDRLAGIFGSKSDGTASDKAKEAEAAERLREELRRKRDRKPGYERDG